LKPVLTQELIDEEVNPSTSIMPYLVIVAMLAALVAAAYFTLNSAWFEETVLLPLQNGGMQ